MTGSRVRESPSSRGREHCLPVVLHADDRPALGDGLVPPLVELLQLVRPVVGELSRRVVVVDEEREACAVPAVAHCSICRSPSELPNAAIGRRPMCRWIPTGLPSLSSIRSSSGSLMSTGLPSSDLELQLAAAPNDLLRRNAIDTLGPRAHELDAAAGDDEGLEAVRAQVGEEFQHRLVDHLGE